MFGGFDETDFDVFDEKIVANRTKQAQNMRDALNEKLRALAADLDEKVKGLDGSFLANYSRHWLLYPNSRIESMRLSFTLERPYTDFPQLNVEIYFDRLIVFLFVPERQGFSMYEFMTDDAEMFANLFAKLDSKHAYIRTGDGEYHKVVDAAQVSDLGKKLTAGHTWFVIGQEYGRKERRTYGSRNFTACVAGVFGILFPLLLLAHGEVDRAKKLLSSIPGDHAESRGSAKDEDTRPTLYSAIREAAEHIGGRMTHKQIVDYIADKYPWANLRAVMSLIRAYTVNNPNRISGYLENQKPSDDPRRISQLYDILFRPDTSVSEVELYDPDRHGTWVIRKTKKTARNPYSLEVHLAGSKKSSAPRGGTGHTTKSKDLSRTVIEALIEAFRGFMSTRDGMEALTRRKISEPQVIRRLLKDAKAAENSKDWSKLLPLLYYGVMPSKKRASEFGVQEPSAPSGTGDMLSRLRKQAGHTEQYIRKQASGLLTIMVDAEAGRVKAVVKNLANLEGSGHGWGIRLGQVTPSLFALDSRLLIVTKRIIQPVRRMSGSVLGRHVQLPTGLSQYKDALDLLTEFQTKLALDYSFQEVLENHWLNLFCGLSYEWHYKPKKVRAAAARQMDPRKRKETEQLAMRYVMEQEKSPSRELSDVSASESYDILSTDLSGADPLYIEVKGHLGDDRTAELTYHEYALALKERDRYILYIVYNLETDNPSPLRVPNPVANMAVEERMTLSYLLKSR